MSYELRKALEAKSDRLNADDLMTGKRIIKITDVRITLAASDGKIVVQYEGGAGKPWKPCKGMGRVMAALWGEDERVWVGRHVELFREPTVVFSGDEVGGIQICGMSHIDSDVTVIIPKNRKQKIKIRVRKLPDNPAEQSTAAATKQESAPAIDTDAVMMELTDAANLGMDKLVTVWKALPAAAQKAVGPTGCPDALKTTATAADARIIAEREARIAAESAAAAALAAQKPEPGEPVPAEPNEDDIF